MRELACAATLVAAFVGFGFGALVPNDPGNQQDLARAYDVLRDPAYLRRAEQIFELVRGGWDSDPHDACPGGVWWTRDPANRDRNTVSTANGALLALALYRETGSAAYLRSAQTMLAWV